MDIDQQEFLDRKMGIVFCSKKELYDILIMHGAVSFSQ